MKNKKAQGGMWWWIVTAIIAVALGMIILFISKGWLVAGGESVDLLSSCENKKGECKVKCDSDERGFFKSGCPKEGESTINPKNYCCIPKDTKET